MRVSFYSSPVIAIVDVGFPLRDILHEDIRGARVFRVEKKKWVQDKILRLPED
jgi:hypothetical protein